MSKQRHRQKPFSRLESLDRLLNEIDQFIFDDLSSDDISLMRECASLVDFIKSTADSTTGKKSTALKIREVLDTIQTYLPDADPIVFELGELAILKRQCYTVCKGDMSIVELQFYDYSFVRESPENETEIVRLPKKDVTKSLEPLKQESLVKVEQPIKLSFDELCEQLLNEKEAGKLLYARSRIIGLEGLQPVNDLENLVCDFYFEQSHSFGKDLVQDYFEPYLNSLLELYSELRNAHNKVQPDRYSFALLTCRALLYPRAFQYFGSRGQYSRQSIKTLEAWFKNNGNSLDLEEPLKSFFSAYCTTLVKSEDFREECYNTYVLNTFVSGVLSQSFFSSFRSLVRDIQGFLTSHSIDDVTTLKLSEMYSAKLTKRNGPSGTNVVVSKALDVKLQTVADPQGTTESLQLPNMLSTEYIAFLDANRPDIDINHGMWVAIQNATSKDVLFSLLSYVSNSDKIVLFFEAEPTLQQVVELIISICTHDELRTIGLRQSAVDNNIDVVIRSLSSSTLNITPDYLTLTQFIQKYLEWLQNK